MTLEKEIDRLLYELGVYPPSDGKLTPEEIAIVEGAMKDTRDDHGGNFGNGNVGDEITHVALRGVRTMINPFQYGGVVTEESFCNRKKELAEVLRAMENSGRAFLYSERRLGKTSLVQLALKKLKKKEYVSVYIDIWPTDGEISFIEEMAKAFGEIDRFKTKDELLEEELAKFVSIHKPDAAHISVIRQFFKAYVTDGGVRKIVDDREYSRLADNPKVSQADIRALDQWREVIPEYVKDYVSLNAFAA